MSLRPLSFDDLFALLAEHGGARYGGEEVSQLQHALQTAALAEQAGAPEALVAAALLHDVGHLVHALGEDASARGLDDHHEARAVGLLRPLFDEAVWRPVALHVEAKRWLCAKEPGYAERLSEESQRSLALQGGAMSAAESAAFRAQAYAEQAITLRRWDDAAKDPAAKTPTLADYRPRLAALVRSG